MTWIKGYFRGIKRENELGGKTLPYKAINRVSLVAANSNMTGSKYRNAPLGATSMNGSNKFL
jgi:hypothetical protein